MRLLYLLLYNKKRWAGYVEEFGSESEQQRKRGNRLVLAYLVGSCRGCKKLFKLLIVSANNSRVVEIIL
jgi:hypothetical protein